MDHLTVVDEIFLRTHRGMGTPIALQGLWRTPDAMEPALLRAIHHRLRLGPLGRRVVNPRVPGARRTWHPNTTAHPLDLLPDSPRSSGGTFTPDPEFGETAWPTALLDHRTGAAATESLSTSAAVDPAGANTAPPGRPQASDRPDVGPLADSAILPWADTLGTDLDPEFGPGWRLSAARLQDGGTVVALTCSHALADARGLIHAITAALRSLESGGTDQGPSPGSRSAGRPQLTVASIGGMYRSTACSEWADARSQWAVILGGTARALRQRLSRPRSKTSRADVPHQRSSGDRHLRPLLLTFDAVRWNTTATALGGTPNSLFIYLVATILWQNGFQNPTITASLPVDTRDEPRVDNDLAMTEITIQRSDTPATIRDLAKSAYQRRMSSPAGLPEEILQVVPDRLAYALSKGAGERDILCSNIGPLPGEVRKVGPHDCTRVAARAIHPDIATFPRTRLAGYLSHLGNTYTLALVSLGTDNDDLLTAVDNACAATGLLPQPW